MTIKEVEEILGIPRASIRFYEKKNLINPDRSDNSYRDYSEEDVMALKRVIILRKIGFSLADIEELLKGSSFTGLVEKNICQLEEQIEELKGALHVSKKIQEAEEEFSEFNVDYWWKEINSEEKVGNRFIDIAGDVLKYEKKLILEEFALADNEGNLRYGKLEAVLRALGMCLFMGVFYYILNGSDRKFTDFAYGFLLPFVFIAWGSTVGLFLHFLEKKHPNAARKIRSAFKILGIIIAIAALLIVILSLFNVIDVETM